MKSFQFLIILLSSLLFSYHPAGAYGQDCGKGCKCHQNCKCGCSEENPCQCEPKFPEKCPTRDCNGCDDDCCRVRFGEGVGGITPTYPWGPLDNCSDCAWASAHGAKGVWFSEDPPLFRPFVADPRQVTYSVGWRFNDHALTQNVIDISFGDTLQIYRWCHVGPGELQIEVEGALWACFDPLHESSPLINADYYVGFPITYAYGRWSFRLRGYHISSHVGDEWLIDHPGFYRRNPSAENIDFFISYELTDDIRIYDGIGYVIHQDSSFRNRRLFGAIGAELRLRGLGFIDCRQQLYGEPFYGMHFRFFGQRKHIDATYVLGYELGKLNGLRRMLRAFVQYHDGYSLEGQFAKKPTHYFSVRLSYGF